MAKKTGKNTNERKLIEAKFALTPESLAAELVRQDQARAKARKAPPKARARGAARAGGGLLDLEAPSGQPERKFYPDFPLGSFDGEPHLVWVKPDIFRHEPNAAKPFRFIRNNGEEIAPGVMLTDGGSIPRSLWFIKDLSPWAYAPAFLIHDWLYDLHHCGRDTRGFEEVRDIMLEGVRTLMESKVCPMDRVAFDLIYSGIDSFVARQVWDKPGCHLP
jgi:hypothetical protein